MYAPDLLQEKMFTLIEGLAYARTYLDDLLVLSQGSFEEYLQDIELVLLRLKNVSLKPIVKTSNFERIEIDYLGYVVIRKGIKPQPKKIEAILKLKKIECVKDAHRLLRIINYHRDL